MAIFVFFLQRSPAFAKCCDDDDDSLSDDDDLLHREHEYVTDVSALQTGKNCVARIFLRPDGG